MSAIEDLRTRLGEIGDLSRAASLLAWDERTMMPSAGGEARSEQLATLAKVRHEMFCDDEVGRLLDAAGAEVGEAEPGEASEHGINADLVRVVSRDWAKARRVPSELRAEMARAGSAGEQAWVEARERIRLLDPAAAPAAERRADPPLRRLLPGLSGLQPSIRPPVGRVRARDVDRADALAAGRAPRGAGAAGGGDH